MSIDPTPEERATIARWRDLARAAERLAEAADGALADVPTDGWATAAASVSIAQSLAVIAGVVVVNLEPDR